jgi:hypothetical protein
MICVCSYGIICLYDKMILLHEIMVTHCTERSLHTQDVRTTDSPGRWNNYTVVCCHLFREILLCRSASRYMYLYCFQCWIL